MSKKWVEELMQLICVRDLQLENIRAAQEMKQRHFPSSLYKYRRVNDNSLSNLKDSTLHLTLANEFNDPYDSAVNFDPYFGETYVERLIEQIEANGEKRREILASENPLLEVMRYQLKGESSSGEFCEKSLTRLTMAIKKRNEQFASNAISKFNTSIRNSYKICSLSERLDSLPLWAHYAENHAGFAMEYDFRSLPFDHLLGLSLWPVRYRGIFDATEILNGLKNRKTFNNLFSFMATLNKSLDWSYEDEWRLVLIDSENDPPKNWIAPLKAVYLGSKISEENARLVLKNAKYSGVPVFRMRLVTHEFRMEAVPYSV